MNITLQDAMEEAANDSDLQDIVLVTKDDNGMIREIPTSCYILSIRSRVFKKMLYGNFKEASLDRIVISDDFPYNTMRSFVHFLHTDEFEYQFDDDVDGSTFDKELTIKHVISLFNAGHYYEVDGIMERISGFSWQELTQLRSSNKHWQNNVFYAASHIADPENRGKTIYNAFQDELKAIFCLGGDVPYKEIEQLNFIPLHLISRVFNNHTVARMDNDKPSTWLKALNVWASQSEEHMAAANNVLEGIDKKNLDTKVVVEVYKSGTRLLSKDTTFDILLELLAQLYYHHCRRTCSLKKCSN